MLEEKAIRTVVVTNPQGFHARPADLFVRLAKRYLSRIEIWNGRERLDGKSIWAILSLGAAQGTELQISAEGADAQAAVDALAALIRRDFEDPEEASPSSE